MKPSPFTVLGRVLLAFAFLCASPTAFAKSGDGDNPKKGAEEPRPGSEIDLSSFRLIPILHGGRKMPMDSFAEQQSLIMRSKKPHGEEPIDWLARVMFAPASTEDDSLFVLDSPDIAEDAGITAEASHRRYSYTDVAEALPHLIERSQAAEDIDFDFRTHQEKETIRFTRAILGYQYLRSSLEFAQDTIEVPVFLQEKLELDLSDRDNKISYHELQASPALREFGLSLMSKTDLTEDDRAGIAVISQLQRVSEMLERVPFPFNVVPLDPHLNSETWSSPANALDQARQLSREGDPELQNSIDAWVAMQSAYSRNNNPEFQAAVDKHLSFVARRIELEKIESGKAEALVSTVRKLKLGYFATILLGALGVVLITFLPKVRGMRRLGSAILLGLLAITLLPIAVRLYGGAELLNRVADGKGNLSYMSNTGLWILGSSLAATIVTGLAFVFRFRGFWRGFGWLVAGLAAFGAVAVTVVTLVGHWDLGPTFLAAFESTNNQMRPFTYTLYLYIIAFLAAFAGLVTRSKKVLLVAGFMLGLGLVFQAAGIELRMFITARPPATNLYSTFPFVAFGCVLLSIAVEFFLRNGVGILCGALTGWTLLLMTGMFTVDGDDTMGNVVPVLASQFWLSTHVICILFGYMGVFFAGVIAHIYLGAKILKLDKKGLKALYRVMLGVVAFGLIFSFLGTMLGGVWADQSWGRFWGWDPKENGALLIVIWCALSYHARLAGLIKDVGMAVMTAIGCVIVMAAWLGLNQLGVGLHSYGFTSKLATVLVVYFVVEILLISVLGIAATARSGKKKKAILVPV